MEPSTPTSRNLTDEHCSTTSDGFLSELPAERRFPIGCHAFKIHVEDGCGNATRAAELRNRLQSARRQYASTGLALDLMPFDNNSDDIPDEVHGDLGNDFIVSASRIARPRYLLDQPGGRNSGCERHRPHAHLRRHRHGGSGIWYSQTGNKDFCETYILVRDNMGACGTIP